MGRWGGVNACRQVAVNWPQGALPAYGRSARHRKSGAPLQQPVYEHVALWAHIADGMRRRGQLQLRDELPQSREKLF